MAIILSPQTDTEVIAHAAHQHYVQNGGDLFNAAVQAATQQFHGAYAIAVIANDMPSKTWWWRVWAVRHSLALGEHETLSHRMSQQLSPLPVKSCILKMVILPS